MGTDLLDGEGDRAGAGGENEERDQHSEARRCWTYNRGLEGFLRAGKRDGGRQLQLIRKFRGKELPRVSRGRGIEWEEGRPDVLSGLLDALVN